MKAPLLETLSMDYLRGLGAKPHYMGLGVIKLPINQRYSFHFYSERAEVICEDPHNHRFGFKSTIIKGTMDNYIYSAEQSETPTPYVLEFGKCEPGSSMEIVKHNVQPKVIAQFTNTAGTSYSIEQETIHKVKCVTPKVITFLEKQRKLTEVGYFIVDTENRTPCPLSFPKPVDECWDIIEYTLVDND